MAKPGTIWVILTKTSTEKLGQKMLLKQIFSVSAIIGLLLFSATSANSATDEEIANLIAQVLPLAMSGDYDEALGLAAQIKGDPYYDVLVVNIFNQAAAKKDCK